MRAWPCVSVLDGAVVMAPMTKGSNLPYRRLCAELGARVLMSEMTVARRLKQRRRSEFALIRRAAGRAVLRRAAGRAPTRRRWAGRRPWSSRAGADLVDVNFGCPIDYFTRKGLGRDSRPPAQAHPAHCRGHEAGGHEHSRHREDPPGLERRRRATTSSRRRPPPMAAPTRSSCTAARATRGTGRRPTGTPSARWRPPCPSRSWATATSSSRTTSRRPARRSGCAGVMAGRGVLDQAVAVPRGDRGLPGHHRRTSAWPSTAATSTSPASTGARTSTA